MQFKPTPIVLEGAAVKLVPLALEHAEALLECSADPVIWRYLPGEQFKDLEATRTWIAEALRAQDAGTDVPFVTVRKSDERVVGTTRFLDIRPAHRGLEIGWTWLIREVHRTPVNTEAKYLMLKQAFEGWGALRVQLKTDARNEQSRTAIQRLGAKFEGVLRKQMVRAFDGYQRDTAMFSILDTEWPEVKASLEAKLAR
jgi:RimJ/RimL family protein N-acetyltransferase